jgi:hypothetical protein
LSVHGKQVEGDAAGGCLVGELVDAARSGMQPGKQCAEVVPPVPDDEQLPVQHELRFADLAQCVDQLREVPRERPVVAAAEVNVGARAKDQAPEAVPFRLVHPARPGWQLTYQAGEHRRHRRPYGQIHSSVLPAGKADHRPARELGQAVYKGASLEVTEILSPFVAGPAEFNGDLDQGWVGARVRTAATSRRGTSNA